MSWSGLRNGFGGMSMVVLLARLAKYSWSPKVSNCLRFYEVKESEMLICSSAHLGFGTPKGHSMFELGKFPKTAKNGSTEVVVENPWASGGPSAPFDQRAYFFSCVQLFQATDCVVLLHAAFYLGVELAVGGTSGYFPDNLGNKPWFDGSESTLYSPKLRQ